MADKLGARLFSSRKNDSNRCLRLERSLLGVVVGALKPPERMVMERRIPISSFQPPHFKNKKYLGDAVKIADEIVAVMQPDSETCFKVCSEYVLSTVIEHLQKQGFKVQKVESTGELRKMVEDGYVRWCVEKGVPKELLQNKRRFWNFGLGRTESSPERKSS